MIGPDRLEWSVRRLILATWMRPVGLQAAAAPPAAATSPSAPGGAQGMAGFAMIFGFLWFLLTLPLLPLVLALRMMGVTRWTIEARARPWGRMAPPVVLLYEVERKGDCDAAIRELAAALERGDGAPVVHGADRVAP